MKKIKKWVTSKTARMGAALSVAAVSLCGVASAAEGDPASGAVETVVTSVTTAVQEFAGKAAGLIGVMVVAALPVAGALWLARKAFGWFKGMAK